MGNEKADPKKSAAASGRVVPLQSEGRMLRSVGIPGQGRDDQSYRSDSSREATQGPRGPSRPTLLQEDTPVYLATPGGHKVRVFLYTLEDLRKEFSDETFDLKSVQECLNNSPLFLTKKFKNGKAVEFWVDPELIKRIKALYANS